jgi:hypothetical protein
MATYFKCGSRLTCKIEIVFKNMVIYPTMIVRCVRLYIFNLGDVFKPKFPFSYKLLSLQFHPPHSSRHLSCKCEEPCGRMIVQDREKLIFLQQIATTLGSWPLGKSTYYIYIHPTVSKRPIVNSLVHSQYL